MVNLLKELPSGVIIPALLFVCILLGSFFIFVMTRVWEFLTGDKKSLKTEMAKLTVCIVKLEVQMETLNTFLTDLHSRQRRVEDDVNFAHRKIRGIESGDAGLP